MTNVNQERDEALQNLLARLEQGDRTAFDALIPLVYAELREIAHRHRLRWTGDETLGTTALVHEAYLRLAGQTGVTCVNRSHFLSVAARAMRHVLVDHYRSTRRARRGGVVDRVPLANVQDVLADFPRLSNSEEEAILALNESLERLGAETERHLRIIECRFFGGMTIEETAEALAVSPATVKRGAAVARAWLARDMERPAPGRVDARRKDE
jgi:RNA polymerase sigma factor (TIGR02999 family)